jgi:peptidyl-prolyl cis-trans isomerase B (cyclophilin B)
MRKLVLLAAAGALLAGCGGSKSPPASTTTAATKDAHGCVPMTAPVGESRTAPEPKTKLAGATTYDVVIATNCGDFTIRLDQSQSPHATASFVSLVKLGFFDHTVFHRIVPGFVIQGGDPTGTGMSGPGFVTRDEPPGGATYSHGVVAMAKTGIEPAGTAGSQFFVVTAPDAQLTPEYAIIGKVVQGLAVVDRIGELGDSNGSGTPTETVEIERATVKTSK